MRMVSLFLLLLLAGCAQYIAPLGGATAKLRFVSLPGNKTEIHQLSNAHCLGSKGAAIATVGFKVSGGLNQGRSQGMLLQETVQRPTASEISLRAEQPFAAQLRAYPAPGPRGAGWDYSACTKGFTLTPKEGEQYEAQLEQVNGGCIINVFRISRERDGSYVRRVAETGHELKNRCN